MLWRRAGEEVVDAEDFVASLKKPLAKMGAEEAGSSGHQHALCRRSHHCLLHFTSSCLIQVADARVQLSRLSIALRRLDYEGRTDCEPGRSQLMP